MITFLIQEPMEPTAGNLMRPYRPSERFLLSPSFSDIIVVHLLALVGLVLYTPTWGYILALLIIGYGQGLGITMIYHRCLTHRSFEFRHRWLERAVVTLTTLAVQNGPIWWCSLHRLHHRFSDSQEDPHDSRKGFWYSHVLWLAYLDPRWKIPSRVAEYQDSVKDISSDPYYRWLDRYYYLPRLVFYVMLYAIGGWSLLFWLGPIATVLQWNVTFSVNSFSHMFGYRNFNTDDNSCNFWLIGFLAMGEGWHNNHHAFPSSARSGFFRWWELDLTYLGIVLLNKIGLVKNIRKRPDYHLEALSNRIA